MPGARQAGMRDGKAKSSVKHLRSRTESQCSHPRDRLSVRHIAPARRRIPTSFGT